MTGLEGTDERDDGSLLNGKSVVVTGAGRGLGRAFAIAAAAAGAQVVVNDIDLAEAEAVADQIRRYGGRALASGHSVADWAAAETLIAMCLNEFGAIDGLVNNAVSYAHFGAAWDEEGDRIRAQVEVNLMGALYCGTHAMRSMRERRSGSIVNVTSRTLMGVEGMSTYTATKGALASVTFSWALELMHHNVRVNAFAPAASTRGHQMAGHLGAFAAATTPPDLCAPGVVYLLSDLSDGVTGQILMLLGNKLGLVRHPRSHPHIEERDGWSAREIAKAIEAIYRPDLEPVGVNSGSEYEWEPA